jgi:hypothetical protein
MHLRLPYHFHHKNSIQRDCTFFGNKISLLQLTDTFVKTQPPKGSLIPRVFLLLADHVFREAEHFLFIIDMFENSLTGQPVQAINQFG